MAGFCVVLMMMGFFVPILIIAVAIILSIAVITIFDYFMESFALYRLCKNNNYKLPILAWIPFYNRVILGEFSDKKKMGYITFILKLIHLLLFIVLIYFINDIPEAYRNIINNLVGVISLITYFLNVIMVHFIMKKSIPKAADILTVLNVFTFGISKAIVLFILRNNKKLIKQEVVE